MNAYDLTWNPEIVSGLPPERRYQLKTPVDDFRWLLTQLGTRGLSNIFLRGGLPVFVPCIGEEGYIAPLRDEDSNGPSTVRTMNASNLITRIALNYLITRLMKKGKGENVTYYEEEAFFTREAAEHALEAVDQAINLRKLKMVTHTPFVRSDGSICDTPGYDDASGALYIPDVDVLPVPTQPGAETVEWAVKFLRHMVSEFVWDGEHDEANFFGCLITPLLRELCPPPYKMFAFGAHQPGSGKSLLNSIPRRVHGGVFRSEMPHDDAELAKTLTSILTQTTAPVVQFDNITGTLRSSRMAGLLTSAVYSDRILGSTNNVNMDNDRVWTCTGNNMNLGGDLIRRTVWCMLDPKVPDPHLRTGFKLNIPQWVGKNRGLIINALLTLVAHWVNNGRPMEMRSSDDYALWSGTVRGILKLAGIPGEFDHTDSQQQKVGTDDEGWGEFLESLRDVFGTGRFTTSQVIEHMGQRSRVAASSSFGERPLTETAQSLVDTLPSELHERYVKARESPRAISKSLGRWFMNRDGRFAGDLVCEKASQHGHKGVAVWRVRKHGE